MRRLRVRSLLVLVVLVPTVGMTVLATSLTTTTWADRGAAEEVEGEGDALAAIMEARAALVGEEVVSSVLSIAGDLGASVEQISELYGVDYEADLARARAAVDADPSLPTLPALQDDLATLRAMRPRIDAQRAAFDEAHALFTSLNNDLDATWLRRLDRLDETGVATFAGAGAARVEALDRTFRAMTSAQDQTAAASEVLLGSTSSAERTAALLDAERRFREVADQLPDGLGPQATEAWRALQTDPATARFAGTLREATAVATTDGTSVLASDPVAFGEAFADGAVWMNHLIELVRAAAADLSEFGTTQAASATRDLVVTLVAVALAATLALFGAISLARSVSRPIGRLGAAAGEIRAGRFDLPDLDLRGPRELADMAAAFNDMTSTLTAVEAHAIALAGDPDDPALATPLPGPTGRAMQRALDRLRSSIHAIEEQRHELEQLAIHDGLTGLLNRTAALEAIERDLSRMRRSGGSVMVLFVDLDGLKLMNDVHGHDAGDDALRLTAEALRATTRESDMTARIGGDEFLVSGIVHDAPAEVDALAERIRMAVREREVITASGEQIPISCSIGIAVTDAPTTVDALIGRADAALYEAKRGGRNRVAWPARHAAASSP